MSSGIDSLISITDRQKDPAKVLFLLESMPVVGAAVSVPGILISLALTVSKISQTGFNEIQSRYRGSQENHQVRQAQLLQDAADWSFILLNQIANLCTLGILNNIIVHIALSKLSRHWVDDNL